MTAISALFAGQLRTLEPEGQQTGIFKQAVEHAEVTSTGFSNDRQADRRYHGGPEKALHQYAQASYAIMISAYPQLRGEAVPGSMGENLSSPGLDEKSVCIGDIFRIGEVLVQVSQPRTPCWKISHRFGIDKLSKFVEERRITGWYYRVLETGSLHRGDPVKLVERPNEGVTIRDFLDIRNQHRPAPQALDRLINCIGLNQAWREKLSQRKAFLAALGQETNSRGQGNPA